MDTELFELCKEVYKRTKWDNKSSTSSSKRLKVWQRGYSISEMGEGNDAYDTTPAEERNKVNIYDWEVRDDPRHKMTTGQEVFKWWYAEVKTIENNVIPFYTSDYILEKLPPSIKDNEELVFLLGLHPNYSGSAATALYEDMDSRSSIYQVFADTPLKALLKLVLALDNANQLPHEEKE